MSRTYRHRHLPTIYVRKYVDSTPRRFYKWKEAEADALMRELYPEAYNDKGRMIWRYWSVERDIINALCRSNPSPVASKGGHPWASWSRIARVKAWYKREGNKRVRHHNRQLLRKNLHLEDEVDNRIRFWSKRDGWDIWVLY